jgi:Ca-activated chloride channel homolog
MFTLDEPTFLVTLLSVFAMLILWIWYKMWRIKAIALLGDKNIVNQMLIGNKFSIRNIRQIFILISLLLLSVAAANPAILSTSPVKKQSNQSIIFVIDISLSMLAEDVIPNRLGKATHIVYESIQKMKSNSVGIIIFTSMAYPLVPLTPDHKSALNALTAIRTDMLPAPGSSLGSAIDMALRYSNKDTTNKPLVFLLSDGENHINEMEKPMIKAIKSGTRFYTLGIGKSGNSLIPVSQDNGRTNFKTDKKGATIFTTLHEQTLKSISDKTGGRYIQIANTKTGINFINSVIQEEKYLNSLHNAKSNRVLLFQWFTGLSLLLLIAELLINNKFFHNSTKVKL